jgi:hypothetical protein
MKTANVSTLSTPNVNLVACFGCGEIEHEDYMALFCPDCGFVCVECVGTVECLCPLSAEDQAAWDASGAAAA